MRFSVHIGIPTYVPKTPTAFPLVATRRPACIRLQNASSAHYLLRWLLLLKTFLVLAYIMYDSSALRVR